MEKMKAAEIAKVKIEQTTAQTTVLWLIHLLANFLAYFLVKLVKSKLIPFFFGFLPYFL
jgi:hypothetical protein